MAEKSQNLRLPLVVDGPFDFRRRADRLRWARENAPAPYNDAQFIADNIARRSVKTLYRWESREVDIKDVNVLAALASAYKVSFPWLAMGLGPRESLSEEVEETYVIDWLHRQPKSVRLALMQLLMLVDANTSH